MPYGITILDQIAFVWFLLAWGLYNLAFDYLPRARFAINHHLKALRRCWVERMLGRDNRVMDSMMLGHAMHSVTFFASTSMIILAGLAGLLGGIDSVQRLVASLAFSEPASRELFELKVLLLAGIFVYAFLKFTWSIRQLNYALVLLGAMPPPPVPPALAVSWAVNTAEVLSRAIVSQNAGIRAYYFSLAAVAWMIGPTLFLIVTTCMVGVLVRRQLWSNTFRAIRRQAAISVPPSV